eukprot:GHVN01100150.1.p2 GENE.GHVN01100150.1~~GHVN01100150.1.p2  ORF type:complete len:103 (-),score=5.21 GHVN01100150.1:881-1189(-)
MSSEIVRSSMEKSLYGDLPPPESQTASSSVKCRTPVQTVKKSKLFSKFAGSAEVARRFNRFEKATLAVSAMSNLFRAVKDTSFNRAVLCGMGRSLPRPNKVS